MSIHTNAGANEALVAQFVACRARTRALVAGLTDADTTVQSMDDASPAKWHLAHTTWFFEQFVATPHVPGYVVFHDRFSYLFNSYYEAVGARQPRPRRGMLTRPSLDEVMAYRAHVDDVLAEWLASANDATVASLVELGIHHEQQHQELLLTDLLHLFAQNPLAPAYCPARPREAAAAPALAWVRHEGGVVAVGHDGEGFAFDCEGPRHQVLLRPFALATRPVTQGEWLEFMNAGGYRTPALWLSDGWAAVQDQQWVAPLYWRETAEGWRRMTLSGETPLEPDAPVAHVSWFEADAFARWAGARLPTEFEWEIAAIAQPVAGHFADSGIYRPCAATTDAQQPLRQLFGDVWEWTASPYLPYPGYRPAAGAVGEYNGKFMNGQYVLRGGSCVTPENHVRATYRNFFQPHQRWQFSGLRLAEDR